MEQIEDQVRVEDTQDTAPETDVLTVDEPAEDDEAVSPEVQARVDAAAARVEAQLAADPELVHGDVVEQVALECDVEVAVELCRQTMQFVPDTVRRRLFEAEHADTISAAAAVRAEQAAAEAKAKQRSQRAAATRAATLAAEAATEKAALKQQTCLDCFQVRSASGVCGCD